jgi:DmsE family decaheme c-type cytochrome
VGGEQEAMAGQTVRKPRRGSGWGFWLAAVAVAAFSAACVTKWIPPEPRAYHRTVAAAEVAEAEEVGYDECEACHDDVKGLAPTPDYHQECEACHGPGELHADSEEVNEIRFPADADCLACHETGRSTHLAWNTSEHQRAGLLCTDCHDPHNREPQHVRIASAVQGAILMHARGTTQLCASCHPAVASQLNLPSHHPIREGMVGCTDCHNPHESRRVALGARTALCTNCHQDHAGPWIFEHPPVTEDCTICHSTHGANSDNLLTTNQPGSCISCHTVTLGHANSSAATRQHFTRCTDCHGAVHGSYADPHLRR